MEYAAVEMSEAALRDVHLTPFAAAFKAGAGATIASFTQFNGVPVTANRAMLTGILREELAFTGVCVSDYNADRELIAHGVAADEADAARLSILAGVDMSMQSGLYIRHLPALVADERVPVARVDQAVRRALALKQRPWTLRTTVSFARSGFRSQPRRYRKDTRSGARGSSAVYRHAA